MDKSKVVHARIDTIDIISCYDMLEIASGKPSINLPVASVVAQVLRGFLNGMRNKDKIPIWDNKDELALRYQEIFGGLENTIGDGDFILDTDTDLPDTGPSLIDAIENAAQTVERNKFLADPDNLENKPTEDSEDLEEDLSEITLDLKSYAKFSELKSRAPKDRFILIANEDPSLQPIIRFVYHNLSIEEWGSEKAQDMITQIRSCKVNILNP